jgi:multiple sugar transport system substrate-binding protein
MRKRTWLVLSLILALVLSVGVLPAIAQDDAVKAFYTPGNFAGKELKVVLNASFLATPNSESTYKKLIADFEAASGAKVTIIPLPENEMYDKVRLEMVNNSGTYDMMHTGAGGAKDYGSSGFLIALPKPPDLDDFYEGDVNQYSLGGELYGMPMTGDTNIFYWRTDLFEKAGLDPKKPPETYEQMREYALKLTTDKNGKHPGEDGFDANNIEVYGTAFKGTAGLASNWEWYNYLYAFGGELFDKDYNPTINSKESVASLAWVVDNFRKHQIYPADTPTYDYSEFHTLFLQGRVAMAVNWPYMWNLIQDEKQSKVKGLVAIGRKPGQVTHGGNIGGWSWNVFKMSKNQDLAIAFAKWMSSPDASLAFAENGVGNSVRKSTAAKMVEKDPVLYGAIAANQGDGRGVKWLDTGPSWLEVEKILYNAIQEALIGAKEPQAAMDDANTAIKDLLVKNKFYDELVPRLLGK